MILIGTIVESTYDFGKFGLLLGCEFCTLNVCYIVFCDKFFFNLFCDFLEFQFVLIIKFSLLELLFVKFDHFVEL